MFVCGNLCLLLPCSSQAQLLNDNNFNTTVQVERDIPPESASQTAYVLLYRRMDLSDDLRIP